MVSKQKLWINSEVAKDKNPVEATIVQLNSEKNSKGYIDYILDLKIGDCIYSMSVYGKNLNTIVDKFGENEALWVGKEIRILFESKQGKAIRTIF